MMGDEKSRILGLLSDPEKWCQHVEAVDASGVGVVYDDPQAVAWDITGAVCRLFGWKRACVLFVQMQRHMLGERSTGGWPPPDTGIEAMKALQAYNDDEQTTYDMLIKQIESVPVSDRELPQAESPSSTSF